MPSADDLVADLLGQCVRARQRRAFLWANGQEDLQSIGAVDAQMERNVSALAILAAQSESALLARLSSCADASVEQMALVHVLGACLVQQRLPAGQQQAVLAYVSRHVERDRIAVRDALWFFPIERELMDLRDGHLDVLLDSDIAAVRGLGIELVGRQPSLRLAPRVQALAARSSGPELLQCELALARCGTLRDPVGVIRAALRPTAAQPMHALQVAGATGHLQAIESQEYWQLSAHPQPVIARRAWLLSALVNPRTARQKALETPDLEPTLRAHVLALCGEAADLVDTIGLVCSGPGAPTRAQREHLLLGLGQVDVAVDVKPVDPAQREAALRGQLLAALRQAHVGINNDADIAPLTAAQVIAPDSLSGTARLRYGRAFKAGGLPDPCIAGLGGEMRQALYVEQGLQGGGARALSAYGPARLQSAFLELSQWAEIAFEQPG